MPDLEKHLRPGEELLWSGKASDFKILDETYMAALIRRSVLCAVICVAVEVLYILTANSSGAGVRPWVAAMIFILCAVSPIALLTRSGKLKKLAYGATDQRLLILSDAVRSVEYQQVRECAFRRDPAGNTTLLCGRKALASRPEKWREITYFCRGPADDPRERCEKFALYAVDTPDGLRAVLAGKIPFAESDKTEVAT